jgi:hypothetical protein
VEISFDTGERVVFTWRGCGTLHVDLLKAEPSGQWNEPTKQYPVAASAVLRGDALTTLLEGFLNNRV